MRPPARQYGALAQPLDDILGAPSRVRVLRALDRASAPLAAAALARETGLTHNGAVGALTVLSRAGMVTETALGSRMVYALNPEHPFTTPLIHLLAAERERRQAVRAAVEMWADAQPAALLAVWLFGSVARREDTFGSDIDLAVVATQRTNAQRFAEALDDALAAEARRQFLRPNILAFEGAEVLALPQTDSGMWKALSRDAIALHGPKPNALRLHLERQRSMRERATDIVERTSG